MKKIVDESKLTQEEYNRRMSQPTTADPKCERCGHEESTHVKSGRWIQCNGGYCKCEDYRPPAESVEDARAFYNSELDRDSTLGTVELMARFATKQIEQFVEEVEKDFETNGTPLVLYDVKQRLRFVADRMQARSSGVEK